MRIKIANPHHCKEIENGFWATTEIGLSKYNKSVIFPDNSNGAP